MSLLFNSGLYAQGNTPVLLSVQSDYSQGLEAYIKGDYAQAKQAWLRAARLNNAKAMFNLGLLHQKGLIGSANQQQAEKWFKLSGKHGYTLSYYHFANYLLSHNTRSDDAFELLKTAADAGLVVAQEQLYRMRRVNHPVANARHIGSQELANATRYLSEDWIKSLADHTWTIQMLAFRDEQKVQAFISQYGLNERAAYFVETGQDGAWYKLIYGVYASKQQADAARNALSDSLKQYGPWLRTIDSVKKIIHAR